MSGLFDRHAMVFVLALAVFVGMLCTLVASKPAFGAANVPDGFEDVPVAGGLASPTAMEFAPDGRLFVTEKSGKLRAIDASGNLLPDPFVDLRSKVDDRGERGLLGVTFDPGFGDDPSNTDNDYVYVYYTQKAENGTPAHNRIVRFKADGNVAEAGSEDPVFELNKLSESHNHNGGAIHFGIDDKLYVAVGENRQEAKAQSLETLFGKMLRINPDGTIPEDNPFYDRTEGEDRAIWARGLRNPFSFAVQPGTGRIHINDVGAQRFEEINRGKAGANYGWPRFEGRDRNRKYQDPIFTYKHDDLPNSPPATSGCAITGGAFYKPQTVQFPADEYAGDYFFADFCNGWIRRLDADGKGTKGFVTGAKLPVDLKVSEDGSLYYLELGTGSVRKVQYTR